MLRSAAVPKVMWVGKTTVILVTLAVIVALLVGVPVAVSGFISPARAQQATTLTVDRTDDDASANQCTGAKKDCSLRGAISKAASGDTIDFQLPPKSQITLGGSQLKVNKSLTIEGPGAKKLTVSANDRSPVFQVGDNPSERADTTVTMKGLTISGGNADSEDAGGGILNQGTLTLVASTVRGNTAEGGGGIYNFGGILTVKNSTISANTSRGPSGHGGGILNDNVARAGGNINGVTTVNKSTISHNKATDGGGIFNFESTLTVTNSTLSGNTARKADGGISNGPVGLTTIRYSTITNNSAPPGEGSGVSSFAFNGITKVKSSIISGNANDDDVDNVPAGSGTSFKSQGYNLIGGGNATAAFNQRGDQTGVSHPKLAPLGFYGGPTKTIALLTGSPAINAIPKTTNGCGTQITTDQRGVKRPQGNRCDIGAFEKRQ